MILVVVVNDVIMQMAYLIKDQKHFPILTI